MLHPSIFIIFWVVVRLEPILVVMELRGGIQNLPWTVSLSQTQAQARQWI